MFLVIIVRSDIYLRRSIFQSIISVASFRISKKQTTSDEPPEFHASPGYTSDLEPFAVQPQTHLTNPGAHSWSFSSGSHSQGQPWGWLNIVPFSMRFSMWRLRVMVGAERQIEVFTGVLFTNHHLSSDIVTHSALRHGRTCRKVSDSNLNSSRPFKERESGNKQKRVAVLAILRYQPVSVFHDNQCRDQTEWYESLGKWKADSNAQSHSKLCMTSIAIYAGQLLFSPRDYIDHITGWDFPPKIYRLRALANWELRHISIRSLICRLGLIFEIAFWNTEFWIIQNDLAQTTIPILVCVEPKLCNRIEQRTSMSNHSLVFCELYERLVNSLVRSIFAGHMTPNLAHHTSYTIFGDVGGNDSTTWNPKSLRGTITFMLPSLIRSPSVKLNFGIWLGQFRRWHRYLQG
jgi:hypothetical protein